MKKKLRAPKSVVAQFDTWCTPKRGISNPEDQTNIVWSWLVETGAPPHRAHEAAGKGEQRTPGWCFARMGQTETRLPDGRTVYIGGEHEDFYDPDFYIYNDVVVLNPDGSIRIYGYPEDAFPPTDFHSATLVGEEIIVIGGLRYPEHRDDHKTSVYRLRLSDFSVRCQPTVGDCPPWLFEHEAKYKPNEQLIVCRGGCITHHPTKKIVENITNWVFSVRSNAWTRLETKPFVRWLLLREDGSRNELFSIQQVLRDDRHPGSVKYADEHRARFADRAHVVRANLYNTRFAPPLEHTVVEPDLGARDYRTHRISVDGVVVRYVESWDRIDVTVEGSLSEERLKTLRDHGVRAYSQVEGVRYKCVPL